ncbi:GTP binding protein [Aphelenchoides avenae]|nr:GTP binding protein [Aphelenchus avenae]
MNKNKICRDSFSMDPVFLASTEEWVHRSLLGEAPSPVVLTSLELEEEVARHNGRHVVSVYDGILGQVFRYLRLTRFYALRWNNIRMWYIPPNTPAYVAAGVVFHLPCNERSDARKSPGFTREFCTTHFDYIDESAEAELGAVDVGNASVVFRLRNATLTDKECVTLGRYYRVEERDVVKSALTDKGFVTKDRHYRVQEGDVLKFTMLREAVKEPDDQCVGFMDTRPRLLHPIESELRICVAGGTNTGKTTLFNNMTCSDTEVSPAVFTTRRVTSKTMEMPDDTFRWLANQFRTAMLRPSRITFVDTPALLEQNDRCVPRNLAPWMHEVHEALAYCDVIYLVTKEFDDPSVELWTGDHNNPYYRCSSGFGYSESDRAVTRITEKQDQTVLDAFRLNATLRNDIDELDTLETIEDNLSGVDRSGRRFGMWDVDTDRRIRYHDWSAKEEKVLEQMRLLSAKPIVYVLNMDEKDSANATSSAHFLKARKYFELFDRDALVLPFVGHQYSPHNASLFGVGELCGANSLLAKTLDHLHVGHFYTASQELVAAWTFKLGMTIREAIELVHAPLGPNVTAVEVAKMRDVIEAGSVQKARSRGAFRRRTIDDEVEDGDLLLLTPGELPGGKITDSTTISATTLAPSTSSAAPTGEKGRRIACWGYAASLVFNLILLIALTGTLVVLFNRKLRDRVGSFIDNHRHPQEPPREPLLGTESARSDDLETTL